MIFLLILGGSHIVSSKDFIDANYEGRLRTGLGNIVDAGYNKYWIQLR